MQDVFVTKIHIGKVRHLHNVDIALSDTQRRHLILTGRNGSGKTSLLEAMRDFVLLRQQSEKHGKRINDSAANYALSYRHFEQADIDISYSQRIPYFFDVTFAYVPAERSPLTIPNSIESIDIQGKTIITRNTSRDFLKYILCLDYRLYGAKSDGNKMLETNIENWFNNFISALRKIYDCEALNLQRDTLNLAFKIDMPGRESFRLHQMSDGYAAFLDIFMELLIRFESDDAVVEYRRPAIVMIDEIETHLHVELQKRVLPFLTQMFPNVQFIVSTHSPVVMTSLENAVVYDLENQEQLENPSIYSYEAVVEGFLNVGQYSDEIKNTFIRYRALYGKERSDTENAEFQRLVSDLELVPPASKELYLAFRSMEDRRKR